MHRFPCLPTIALVDPIPDTAPYHTYHQLPPPTCHPSPPRTTLINTPRYVATDEIVSPAAQAPSLASTASAVDVSSRAALEELETEAKRPRHVSLYFAASKR